MKIDNFNRIAEILKFESKDDFYFLQILQRKKDGCNVTDHGNNAKNRVIKTYYIYSLTDLEKLKPKIIELCQANNARAYINLNRRDAKQVALEAAKLFIDLVREDNCSQGYRAYEHACGVTRSNKAQKYWIIDVDENTEDARREACLAVNECRSNQPVGFFGGYDNVKHIIPTVHGWHLIATPFDPRELEGKYEIKKDNPTLLYYDDLA